MEFGGKKARDGEVFGEINPRAVCRPGDDSENSCER